MSALISQIVMEPLSLRKASQHIKKMAESLPQKDRVKFIETVETELLALHEGNFARYRISPSQFKTWQALINSTQA